MTAKVSKFDPDAVRGDCWEIHDIDDELAPGEQAVDEARHRAKVIGWLPAGVPR